MNQAIQTLTVYALPLILAITLHEAAHAYAAKRLGDATAYMMGRMTLNPVKHIDPIGTIAMPLILFAVGSPFLFGYAKPVPVQFGNLRNPRRDMALVALAGPGANMVMAFLWLVFAILLRVVGIDEPFFLRVAEAGVLLNLVILAFNLFPVPPLDGGRVMTSLLPNRLAYRFAQLEPYGFFIVIGLVLLGALRYWMIPVMEAAHAVLMILVSPLTFLLR
ncbi:MAG TPA: site-2 protease family protein [Noviherbaspirillum sp.]|nr:site-2 protease family protein [Noviherbaspirillum sp.]